MANNIEHIKTKGVSHMHFFLLLTLMMIFKCWLFADIANIQPAQTSVWCLASTWLSWCAISMLIASIVFVARRWWTTMLVLLTFDIWFIANIFYYKAYQLFITFHAIRIAYNLRGFTNSLWAFCDWTIWIWPLLTFACVILLIRSTSHKRRPIIFGLVWITAIACSILGSLCHYYDIKRNTNPEVELTVDFFHPLSSPKVTLPASWEFHLVDGQYIQRHSLPANLFRVMLQGIQSRHAEHAFLAQAWADEEEQMLKRAFYTTNSQIEESKPQGHLVLILVESLNGWLFDAKTAEGDYVCKNLMAYIDEHPVLISRQMFTQVRHGCSGDGQMLLNTGLCPLIDGVACILHGGNVFPNLAHFYEDGVIISPSAKTWNQDIITYSYGYRKLIEPNVGTEWSDRYIFSQLRTTIEEATAPSCMLALTVATHHPFNRISKLIDLPDSVPEMTNHYLQCLHFTDSYLGEFLQWADTAECMTNSTIVIVGDHTWPVDSRDDCQMPFIMRSPAITKTKEYGICYQMDIYPTILNAIGQSNYYWHGFGIDLLNQTDALRNFTPNEALYFSDRLIRTNYFATIKE